MRPQRPPGLATTWTLTAALSFLGGLGGLAPCPAHAAGAPRQDDAAAPAAARWAALLAEHDASELGYVERAAAFDPRFRAFADAHPGTPEALEALFTVFGDCWWKRSESEGAMHAAAKLLAEEILAEYADADGLTEFATRAYVLDQGTKLEVFGALRESAKPLLQATGVLGLARVTKGEESAALYRLLQERYADVPYRRTTHGELANAILNRHAPEDLAVGRVAPDIAGEDVDGNAFRLSDYRGKVVLLDFWGDW